jgi:hypothetical protein
MATPLGQMRAGPGGLPEIRQPFHGVRHSRWARCAHGYPFAGLSPLNQLNYLGWNLMAQVPNSHACIALPSRVIQ